MRFAFISSNRNWGGSEELWAATASNIAAGGHRLYVYKSGLCSRYPPVRKLREMGCTLVELAFGRAFLRRMPLIAALHSSRLAVAGEILVCALHLALRRRPDLVVISQGGNQDGWPLIGICRRLRLRYVCISHKASDLYWPADRWRGELRRAYAGAAWCFFVAEQNRRLTEEQIGAAIPNASVVRNPFKVPWQSVQPWAPIDDGIRLGCIGRLNPLEKGQDILLRVLTLDKWRNRPISVTFLGEGAQNRGLAEMARHLGLSNVRFAGYREDIAAFWVDHHALVLASRAEGLPLVLVEAALSGRIAIVTDVGGNAEFIEEGRTGFIAEAPTEKSFDEALERAWAHRHTWQRMGVAAAEHARRCVPQDPAAEFADQLLKLAVSESCESEGQTATMPAE